MRSAAATFPAILIFCSTLSAQLGTPFTAKTATAVKCGRLVDVKTGQVLTNAVITFKGNRIASIVPGGTLPAGGVDAGESTCLPGLIDVHTHLAHLYRRAWQPKIVAETATVSPALRALIGVRTGLEQMHAGITTVRDLGNSGYDIAVSLRNAIRAGLVPGPSIVAATRALSGPMGQFPPLQPYARSLITQEYDVVNGVDDARRAVRESVAAGADVFKVIASQFLSGDEMKAIVEEAHRLNRRVAAHAFGDKVVRMSVEAGVDSIEHGVADISSDVFRTMAQKGTFLVPTGVSADEENPVSSKLPAEEQAAARAKALSEFRSSKYSVGIRNAMAAGVKIAMGADIYEEQEPPGTRGTMSLATLYGFADAGMTPLQALQTATVQAADLLDWNDLVGTLDPGKLADVIAVDGDPLSDIRAVKKVWLVIKAGKVMRNDRQP